MPKKVTKLKLQHLSLIGYKEKEASLKKKTRVGSYFINNSYMHMLRYRYYIS